MGREAVLGAVRDALRRGANPLGHDPLLDPSPSIPPWQSPSRPIDDPIPCFIAAAEAVGTEVHHIDGPWERHFLALFDQKAAVCPQPGIAPGTLECPIRAPEEAAQHPSTTIGLAVADAAIAESGSVIIDTDGAHLPTLITETSCIVVPSRCIVPRLEDLSPPSPDVRSRILITGPSRTADIEKKLVLGAHGPRRLVLLISDDI